MAHTDDLLAGLKRGEEAAFRHVVEGELDGIYALALGILGREADAEDACQEVLLKLLRFAPRLSPSTSLRAWLRRVCLNYCLDQCRRRRPALQAEPAAYVSLESSSPAPQRCAEEAELREVLREALAQLPERQRAAFVLRHFEGCAIKEIAETLGCAEGTAKTHLSRAVSRLRILLGDLRSGGEV
ncbi:MAG: sigma-70 family RNA polymerase sigma factor [Proteobacteria bacterium]|nr:sigma-70 family RNA polymerase sigma factor [Pseudomonadota bacterium]